MDIFNNANPAADTDFLGQDEDIIPITEGQVVQILAADGQPGGHLYATIVKTDISNGTVEVEDLAEIRSVVAVDRVQVFTPKDILRIVNRYFLFEDIVHGVADADATDEE